MKELSIEEKARRYDEAIERAKHSDGIYPSAKELKEYIFPELRESEDERIRKEMIFYFQEEIPLCSIQEHADKMKEFVAWLESLRPQSQWKPSKEQMEAVRIAAEIGTANNSWAMGILKGMYQDLKKQKG